MHLEAFPPTHPHTCTPTHPSALAPWRTDPLPMYESTSTQTDPALHSGEAEGKACTCAREPVMGQGNVGHAVNTPTSTDTWCAQQL